MKPLFFLAALLLTLTAFSQNFEGKIVYTNTYKSKIPGISDEQLTAMMGSRQEYYIRNGQYKSITNGTLVQWQLYRNSDNIIYNKMSSSDTLMRIDAATGGDKTVDIMSVRAAGTVLGYECDQLAFTAASGKQTFLYSPKLAVDPEHFKQHHFGNWYQYVSKAKALPLHATTENDQFILETTAIEVTPQSLGDAFFELKGQ